MTFSRILRDTLFEVDPLMLDNQIDFEQNDADRSRYTIGHNIHPASEMEDEAGGDGMGAPYDGAAMGGGMPGGDMGAGMPPGGGGMPGADQLQPIQPGMGIPGQEDPNQQQPMEAKDDFDLYLDALLDESVEDISEGPYDFIRGMMPGGGGGGMGGGYRGGYPGMGGGFRGSPGGYPGGGYQGGNRGGYTGQPQGQPYGGQQQQQQPYSGQGRAGGGYQPPGPQNYAGFNGPQQPPASVTAGGPAAVQNWQTQMGAVGRGVENPMRSGVGTAPPTFGSRGQVTGQYANQGNSSLRQQQAGLIKQGYDLGPTGADGVMGKYTRGAIQQQKANGGGAAPNPNDPMNGIKQNAAGPGTGDRGKDLTRTQGTMNTPFGANSAPEGTEFGKSAGGANTFQPPFKPAAGAGETIPAGTNGIGVAREPVKFSDEGWGSMGNPMNLLNISRTKQPDAPTAAPNTGAADRSEYKDTTPTKTTMGGAPMRGDTGLQQQQPPRTTVTGAGAGSGPMSPSTAPQQAAPPPAQTSAVSSAQQQPSPLNASKDWGLDWKDYNILHEGDRSNERKRRGY